MTNVLPASCQGRGRRMSFAAAGSDASGSMIRQTIPALWPAGRYHAFVTKL